MSHLVDLITKYLIQGMNYEQAVMAAKKEMANA